MLEKVYYGNTVEEWLIALAIIVGAMLLNKLVVIIFNKILKPLTAKTKTEFDDIIVEALKRPLTVGIVLFAIWLAINRLHFDHEDMTTVNDSFKVLAGLNITWLFARFATKIIEEREEENKDLKKGRFYIDGKFYPLIKRTIIIVVWILGIVMTLHCIGVRLTTVVGALGIGGIAVALAAQDILKNIFAGLTILTNSAFRLGDVIKFDGNEGTVIDIGMRTTNIRTYDKRLVTIPNYKLTDSAVTNISSEPGRRIVMELGLTYDTPPEKMEEAILILKDMHHRVREVKDKDIVAVFSDFAESSMNLTFIYFINKTADIWETRSKVNFEILRSFGKAGLNFAFPSRTVYVSK
ncbi:MAG: mechanosensitive ion channel family protein [Tannerella sp.]|jgi:MscS family membrane protein|nr:mechanosensitive ion channel family protein [Tannerella sp.]